MGLTLERSSTDADMKEAYDKGISIQSIADKTERSVEYVHALVYVDGDKPDGISVEDQILAGQVPSVNEPAAPQAPKK